MMWSKCLQCHQGYSPKSCQQPTSQQQPLPHTSQISNSHTHIHDHIDGSEQGYCKDTFIVLYCYQFSCWTYLMTAQRRLDPGMDTPLWFFQIGNQKEYQTYGNNTICLTWKSKHFLFYAQGCGAKIEPATPSWRLNFKWP